eukprot:UN06673
MGVWSELKNTWLKSNKGRILLAFLSGTVIIGLSTGISFKKRDKKRRLKKKDDPKEQSDNYIWKLTPELFPGYTSDVTKYVLMFPAIMGVWYGTRMYSKSINVKIVSAITKRNWDYLFPATIDLVMWSFPAAIGAKLMSWGQKRLQLAVRTQLTDSFQQEYLSECYLLKPEISHAEQRLTADIDKFSAYFAELVQMICWSGGGILVVSTSLMSKMGTKEFLVAV